MSQRAFKADLLPFVTPGTLLIADLLIVLPIAAVLCAAFLRNASMRKKIIRGMVVSFFWDIIPFARYA
jgi:hypothetical protein